MIVFQQTEKGLLKNKETRRGCLRSRRVSLFYDSPIFCLSEPMFQGSLARGEGLGYTGIEYGAAFPYLAAIPPSTDRAWPVVWPAPSEHSQMTALATSSVVPILFMGITPR